jgi:hypothetical protein
LKLYANAKIGRVGMMLTKGEHEQADPERKLAAV